VIEHKIIAIRRVEARLTPFSWPFARERAADIAAFWSQMTAAKPAMFNGQVLMQHRSEVEDGVFRADYFQIDYATFMAWTRWGFEQMAGAQLRNGFAMGAIRTRDNAYLMGVMGAHTANAGKIYFAAGTPDLGDVTAEGAVDLAGSVMRELGEETGLRPDEVTAGDDWRIVLSRERVAFMRDVYVDLPADEARALILARLSRQAQPELADIAIARSAADIDAERMPVFMQFFLRDAFKDKT
jgi:8-oxo-dGTP pyrophosphatase MutT (NUDIX family)